MSATAEAQAAHRVLPGLPVVVSEALRALTERTGIVRFTPLRVTPGTASACAPVTITRGTILFAENWECSISRFGMSAPPEEVHALHRGPMREATLGALVALRRALVVCEAERRRLAKRVRKSSRKNGFILAADDLKAARSLVDEAMSAIRLFWPGAGVPDDAGTYRMEKF